MTLLPSYSVRRFNIICIICIMLLFLFLIKLYSPINTTKTTLGVMENDILRFFSTEELRNGKPIIPPFINRYPYFMVAPKYNITFCRIAKSMSTLTNGLSCLLYDPEGFLKNNRSIVENWQHRYCEENNEHKEMEKVKEIMGGNFTKLVFMRDPISRFVSLFSDKCLGEGSRNPEICYHCHKNISCFIEKQYERVLKLSRDPNMEVGYVDHHTLPFSWYCNFGEQLNEIKVINLDPRNRADGISKFVQVLEENHVSADLIKIIKEKMFESDSAHATFKKDAPTEYRKEILQNPILKDYMKRMYLTDYLIFKFDYSIFLKESLSLI